MRSGTHELNIMVGLFKSIYIWVSKSKVARISLLQLCVHNPRGGAVPAPNPPPSHPLCSYAPQRDSIYLKYKDPSFIIYINICDYLSKKKLTKSFVKVRHNYTNRDGI